MTKKISKLIVGGKELSARVRYIPEINKTMETTFNYIKHSDISMSRRLEIKTFYKVLLQVLEKLEINSILDVGSGEGYTLDRLKKAGIGTELVGIDNLPAAVRLGKELFPELKLKIGDIYNLPFKDNSNDLVICTEVLEHLEHPDLALKELVRVSKKYVALSVPNEPFFSFRNLMKGKHIKRLGNTPGHINQWTSNGFIKIVKQEKVDIVKSRYPFPFALLLLQKL